MQIHLVCYAYSFILVLNYLFAFAKCSTSCVGIIPSTYLGICRGPRQSICRQGVAGIRISMVHTTQDLQVHAAEQHNTLRFFGGLYCVRLMLSQFKLEVVLLIYVPLPPKGRDYQLVTMYEYQQDYRGILGVNLLPSLRVLRDLSPICHRALHSQVQQLSSFQILIEQFW